ncbi:MAG TPA: type II secretion system protein GspN [Candidatus Binataceae bacterium]|nr:type II secretion system protein GspN [Candidatus Binataceae bacterium]
MKQRFARPRGRKAWAAYLAVGGLVFAAFLISSFPYSATVSSMLAPYHLRLAYDRQRISPPIGVELINVSLIPDGAKPSDPLLQSPMVTLAPTFSALFMGHPGFHLRARLYDGIVKTNVSQRAGIIDFDFNVSAINPAQCLLFHALGAIVEGRVSAAGTARIVSPNLPDNSAELTVDAHQIVVTLINGIGFPPIELGNVTGAVQLSGGTLAIERAQATGGDAEIEAAGSIQLGATLADSTVDLQFTLNPTPAGRDHLGFFLNLLPHHQDPASPYILNGPLLQPNLS